MTPSIDVEAPRPATGATNGTAPPEPAGLQSAEVKPMIFYTGSLTKKGEDLGKLPKSVFDRFKNPDEYHPRPALISAANVALLLGQPLLLTGDPGVGKSRFAAHLAAALGLGDVLEFPVKSTTTARDMLYSFDELRRFRDTSPAPLESYLAFNALGRAILFSGGKDRKLEQMPGLAYDPVAGKKRPETFGDLYPFGAAAEPRRKVVLIDEFDKAPRDTPNDLLNEIERLRFNIPELGLTLAAHPDFRPIVVITSNSERNLPDPFLRRCVYFDIPFPEPREMLTIVWGQLEELKVHPEWRGFLGTALGFFYNLRTQASLTRNPGTSELLAWLSLLFRDSRIDKTKPIDTKDATVANTLSALAKVSEDQMTAAQFSGGWTPSTPEDLPPADADPHK
jgi:MoxR-like ATPase